MESFQEAVVHTLGSIARHGINGNIVDAAEDAVFDIGIVALQAAEQDLDLLPLGTTAAVVAHGAVLSKAAGRIRVMPGKLVLWSLGGMACIWEP